MRSGVAGVTILGHVIFEAFGTGLQQEFEKFGDAR